MTFIYLGIGFVFGLVANIYTAWRVYVRLVNRLVISNSVVREMYLLENRRLATDFGRTESTRPGAGPAGSLGSLFSVRPGALMLDHLSKKILRKVLTLNKIRLS